MSLIHVKELSDKTLDLTEETLVDVKRQCGNVRNWSSTPFPINESINRRVILYDGEIKNLRADAIVNPTNENFTQLEYIKDLAGPELENYIKQNVRFCSTGHIRCTPGFKSNFTNILHAVPPKFQHKYKTAVETALFHTYFRILETMLEKKLSTVVMPVLVTARCSLPMEENLELQLRVIRRMLEKQERNFDKIVVHVKDAKIHRLQFRSYFPRSSIEEEVACYRLGCAIGGLNGEPLIPERQIRIKSKPASYMDHLNQSIDLRSGLDLSVVVGKTLFSKMHDDFDKEKCSGLSTLNTLTSKQVAKRRPSPLRGCVLF